MSSSETPDNQPKPKNKGGRPKGSMGKRKLEFLRWLDGIANDPEWQKAARQRLIAGKAPHIEQYMCNRVGGKPLEKHEISGPDGSPLAVREIRNVFVAVEPKVIQAQPAQLVEAQPTTFASETNYAEAKVCEIPKDKTNVA